MNMPRPPTAKTLTAVKQQKIKARKILRAWLEQGYVELGAYVYIRRHEPPSFLQQLLQRHGLSPPPNASEFEPQHQQHNAFPTPALPFATANSSSAQSCSSSQTFQPGNPSSLDVAPLNVLEDEDETSSPNSSLDQSSRAAADETADGNGSRSSSEEVLVPARRGSCQDNVVAEVNSGDTSPPSVSMDVDDDSYISHDGGRDAPSLSPSEFLRDWLLRSNVSLRKVDEFLQGIHKNKVILSYKDLPKTARTLLKMDNTVLEADEEIVEMQGQAPKNATKAAVAQFEKSKNGNFVYYGIERCLKMQTPGMVKREKYIRLLRMINAACPTALSSDLYRVAFAEELEIEKRLQNAGFQPAPMDEFSNARPRTTLIVLKLHVDQVCPFKNSTQASTLPLLAAVHKVAAFDVRTKRIMEGTS